MAVKRLTNLRPQYFDSNGLLASGYRLFFYAAGSSTKQNTYNSSAGTTPNTNPIVLNALGEPAVEIWLTTGLSYKVGLAIPGSDDPPASFVWTEDVVAGVNDTTASFDQWIAGPAPTFISTTSFSLVGDQTSTFSLNRRLKTTNTSGTIYSSISASSFGAGITTVTVVNDSGVLDSGLSAVSYGIISWTNGSLFHAWASYTATLTLVGGAGNTVPTYTGQTFARWQQVGKRVDVEIDLVNTAGGTAGAGTGQVTIALPVAISASGSAAGTAVPCGLAVNGAANYPIIGNLAASAGTIPLAYLDTIASSASFTGALQNNVTRRIAIKFSYPVD